MMARVSSSVTRERGIPTIIYLIQDTVSPVIAAREFSISMGTGWPMGVAPLPTQVIHRMPKYSDLENLSSAV